MITGRPRNEIGEFLKLKGLKTSDKEYKKLYIREKRKRELISKMKNERERFTKEEYQYINSTHNKSMKDIELSAEKKYREKILIQKYCNI